MDDIGCIFRHLSHCYNVKKKKKVDIYTKTKFLTYFTQQSRNDAPCHLTLTKNYGQTQWILRRLGKKRGVTGLATDLISPVSYYNHGRGRELPVSFSFIIILFLLHTPFAALQRKVKIKELQLFSHGCFLPVASVKGGERVAEESEG